MATDRPLCHPSLLFVVFSISACSSEAFVPPQLFYNGKVDYFDLQRLGGLLSHLKKTLKGLSPEHCAVHMDFVCLSLLIHPVPLLDVRPCCPWRRLVPATCPAPPPEARTHIFCPTDALVFESAAEFLSVQTCRQRLLSSSSSSVSFSLGCFPSQTNCSLKK